MGRFIEADFGGPGPLLSKRQLAKHPEIRRSTRWLERRVGEGMPSQLDGNRRLFHVGEVLTWLRERGRLQEGPDKAKAPPEFLRPLEQGGEPSPKPPPPSGARSGDRPTAA